jgi:protein-S-isoprenylcysteine O-methyltransferase Ste14
MTCLSETEKDIVQDAESSASPSAALFATDAAMESAIADGIAPGLSAGFAAPAAADVNQRLPGQPTRWAGMLDHMEGVAVLSLYAWLVVRLVGAYLSEGGAANLLLLPSEGMVVGFVLFRRSAVGVSQQPGDWALGFGATVTPLLLQPAASSGFLPSHLGAALLLFGMLIQLHAKVSLGRSIGCVAANRGLKFSGPYRYVRHPMYLGYLVSDMAFGGMNATVWNLSVLVLTGMLQVGRVLAEERFLQTDPQYREYTNQVQYRLIPGVF